MSHEIAHNLGIKHDCINYECRYWESSYVGPRVHEGKDCYGYMDYRDETPGWSECSTNDFADYVNSQVQFCLKSLASDGNKSIKTGNVWIITKSKKYNDLKIAKDATSFLK